ncbi:MAG: hypothetical protein FWD25_13745 [Clostridia bacterium]|nr:hypothetical protein [Clostridia bacterium]
MNLIEIFPDMRYPYAQAMVLVVLGYKADQAHIPWFIDQYKNLNASIQMRAIAREHITPFVKWTAGSILPQGRFA